MGSLNLRLPENFGNINEFLDLTIASGLINENQLTKLVDEFRQDGGSQFLSRFGLSITGFTGYLVHRGFLTCWQVQMLRSGKVKGFFYENELLLLDCWRDGTDDVYLARRRSKSDIVVAQFSHGAGGMQYRILKVLDKSGLAWMDESPASGQELGVI